MGKAFLIVGIAVALVPLPARAATVDPYDMQRWTARYNGPANSYDTARAMAISPDGATVFVTGESRDVTQDYATLAFDADTGARLWVARYNGPANSLDSAYDIAVSSDGTRVFVTGQSSGVGTGSDYGTVAYNAATGAQLWGARYHGPLLSSSDIARAITFRAGKVFVTGESTAPGQDYATVAYDAVTGAQLWAARYNGPGNAFDIATAIVASPDGSKVFVTGDSWGINSDYGTVAYNALTGAQLWVGRYTGTGADQLAHGIAISPDGSKVLVTGRSRGVGSDLDYGTVAYNAATGTQLWAARYSGPGLSGDIAQDVAVSPDGTRVFVTGHSLVATGNWDYATLAYNATTGAQMWVTRYDGPASGEDIGYAIGISPDGSEVYATGGSVAVPSSRHDFTTIAYDAATGGQRWLSRFDGLSNIDTAYAIVVSPDGSRVYAAGQSIGNNADYGVMATAKLSTVVVNPAIADVSAAPQVYLTLSARLIDAMTEEPIAGQTVTFLLGAQPLCTGVTAPNGMASCGSVQELAAVATGGLRYTATFDGNAAYLSATGSGPLLRVLGVDLQ